MIYIFIMICMLFCSCSSNEKSSESDIHTPSPEPTVTITPSPTVTEVPQSTPEEEKNIIASFKTPLLDKTSDRIHNIKLAAKAINGCIVKSGEVFSFNETVGNRTEEKGYRTATVLVGEKHQDGIGGGVCQVASTIYNVIKKADMKITEHHTHKVEVEYAPDGTDATVNYDNLDFKFQNTSEHDIILVVKVRKDDVYTEIREHNYTTNQKENK